MPSYAGNLDRHNGQIPVRSEPSPGNNTRESLTAVSHSIKLQEASEIFPVQALPVWLLTSKKTERDPRGKVTCRGVTSLVVAE